MFNWACRATRPAEKLEPDNMWSSVKILMLSLFVQMPVSAAFADAVESRTLLSAKPANVMSAIADMGYTLTALESPEGTAMLEDAQKRFVISLAECSKAYCKLVQARVCIIATNASAEHANRWNQNQLYGRVTMRAEGVICIDNTAYVPNGLVSIAQLRSQIEGLIEVRPAVESFFAKG